MSTPSHVNSVPSVVQPVLLSAVPRPRHFSGHRRRHTVTHRCPAAPLLQPEDCIDHSVIDALPLLTIVIPPGAVHVDEEEDLPMPVCSAPLLPPSVVDDQVYPTRKRGRHVTVYVSVADLDADHPTARGVKRHRGLPPVPIYYQTVPVYSTEL